MSAKFGAVSGGPAASDGCSGPRGSGSTRTLGAGDENDDSGYQDGSQSREVEAMHGPYPHRLRDPAAPERYAPHTYLVPAPCSTVAAAL